MDAFMMGRGAARLVILLAETDNSEDWATVLENTKQGMAHGARQLGIAAAWLEKWICDLEKLVDEVRNNRTESTMIMAHVNRLENHVGQMQSGSIVMRVKNIQILTDIKDSYVVNGPLVAGSVTKIGAMDKESAEVWLQIAEMVHKSGNVAAGDLFNTLSKELQEGTIEKDKRKQYWDGLVKILPGILTIGESVVRITKLFE